MPRDPTEGLGRLEWTTLSALLALLIAAALPSIVQVHRAHGEAVLDRTRATFASALGSVHGRWLLEGGSSRSLRLGQRTVHLSEDGWPTVDPRNTGQDTAAELYALLVDPPGSLDSWRTEEEPQQSAGTATFRLVAPGGGAFTYDASTGRIFSVPN